MKRFVVVVKNRERHVGFAKGLAHAPHGRLVGKRDVCSEYEDRRAEPGEQGGDSGQRRAGVGVGDDQDALRQGSRRRRCVAHRESDGGEDSAQERQVACEKRRARELQEALVGAHTPSLATGDESADGDGQAVVCRVSRHVAESNADGGGLIAPR